MTVLLDENPPHRLRLAITGHTVVTVAFQGWSGVKKGELLKLAEAKSFDVLLTADRNRGPQSWLSTNMQCRVLALVVLTALDWDIVSPRLVDIVSTLMRQRRVRFRWWSVGRFADEVRSGLRFTQRA